MKKPVLIQISSDTLIALNNIDFFFKKSDGTVDVYVSGGDLPVATLSVDEYDALLSNFELINLYDETHPEQASFQFKEE